MNPISRLCHAAYSHIRFLVEDIGPRPAGSLSEQRAFDYIAGKLEECDYDVTRQPVPFAAVPSFSALYVVGGLLLVISGWGVVQFPWLPLLLPLIIISLPQFGRWEVERRKCNEASENMIVYSQPDQNNPTLIFCAHVDTAKAVVFQKQYLLRLYDQTLFIGQRVAIAAASVAALNVLGFTVPDLLVKIIAILANVVGLWWVVMEVLSQLGGKEQYSPGAYDNASGVGVVLALAEYYSRLPLDGLRLGFLFTGAEETGLHGSRAFADQPGNWGNTAILNFDMVGAGDQLHYITMDGTIIPLRTDTGMNELLKKADTSIHGLWYTKRSADFRPFLKRRIPAASIQMSGNPAAEQGYHSMLDTMSLVQLSALDQVLRTVTKFTELYEDSKRGKNSTSQTKNLPA